MNDRPLRQDADPHGPDRHAGLTRPQSHWCCMYVVRCLVLAIVAISILIHGSAESPAEAPRAPAEPQVIALVGGLIRTQSDAGDFVGTIVIRDGKVVAVGRTVDIPEGANRIELAGHVITPGLIDAHSSHGLHSTAVRETGREGTLDILDGVDPFSMDWKDAAQQGVTAVYVQPNGSLGGSGAVLLIRGATTVQELALRAPAAVQASLGVSTEAAVSPNAAQLAAMLAQLGIQAPQASQAAPTASNTLTRFAQYEALKAQFDAAKRYAESKPTRIDPAKEILAKAIRREISVRMEVGHEDDLRNALQLTRELKLQAVFEHIERIKPIPEELSQRKIDIVVGPLWPPRKSADVRKLALDGRRFALGTFGEDPKGASWLRMHAAAAIADGYPRDRVLRALTRDAAEILGVGDKTGSIATGRVADLAVFAGDPLDPAVPVRMTICQGFVTHNRPDVVVAAIEKVAKATIPTKLSPRYTLKTTRLLQASGEFSAGELHVENGQLTEKSPSSSDVVTIDVGDSPVTPGLVAAQLVSFNEVTPDADAGHLRGIDGIAPKDARLKSLRDGGFLSVVAVPGSNNVIAGTAALVNGLDGSNSTECGMKFVFSAAARDTNRYPQSLFGQVEMIAGRLRGEPSQSELVLPQAVRKSVLAGRDQNLAAVRDGRAIAWCEAQTPSEIRAVLRVVADHKLRGVLVGPRQLDDVADEIKSAGIPVVLPALRPADTEKTLSSFVALSKANIPFAFSGDANDIRASTARLVNAGLPRSTARRALLASSPEKFGLPANTSTLTSGTPASFVVWNGDPVDPSARPIAVISQGLRVGGS